LALSADVSYLRQPMRVRGVTKLIFDWSACRLVRQADEWGKRYNFWSCADVDIVLPKDYK
jgi:hypothetical protein